MAIFYDPVVLAARGRNTVFGCVGAPRTDICHVVNSALSRSNPKYFVV
jgi:hypothetical protein